MPVTPDCVREVLDVCGQAAEANRSCPARRGNVVALSPDNAEDVMIVADLHGNRLNFEKLLRIADLDDNPRRHLVMQEVCHGGPEYPGEGGGCMSHLLLEDCIRLKTEYPERFHFLLSNHELAELGDFPICKSRKMLNLMFRSPELYKVGVAGAPVPDQALYDTIYQERYMGLPDANAEGYKVGSPITFADGLQGKLLIIHGTGDDNVHFQGTQRLLNKLIDLKKQFSFMEYPNRRHGISGEHIDTLRYGFFQEHLPAGGR